MSRCATRIFDAAVDRYTRASGDRARAPRAARSGSLASRSRQAGRCARELQRDHPRGRRNGFARAVGQSARRRQGRSRSTRAAHSVHDHHGRRPSTSESGDRRRADPESRAGREAPHRSWPARNPRAMADGLLHRQKDVRCSEGESSQRRVRASKTRHRPSPPKDEEEAGKVSVGNVVDPVWRKPITIRRLRAGWRR